MRRHRAAVTLCSLLYADTVPLLRTPERAAQALALGASTHLSRNLSTCLRVPAAPPASPGVAARMRRLAVIVCMRVQGLMDRVIGLLLGRAEAGCLRRRLSHLPLCPLHAQRPQAFVRHGSRSSLRGTRSAWLGPR